MPTPADLARAVWRKSTDSDNGSGCVYVADLGGDSIGIVETDDPATITGLSQVTVTTRTKWGVFLRAAKEGQFDDL
ncbi:MAG: DUF397 domain-containing protein [Micromonosporaceae bacterium]